MLFTNCRFHRCWRLLAWSWISSAFTPFGMATVAVSQLLTLLAFYHHGYEVGRYYSADLTDQGEKLTCDNLAT